MEQLLDAARQVADQAEVVTKDVLSDRVQYENARLKEVDSSQRRGVGLRLIKGGKIGYAYTRNLRDRDELIENALATLAEGVEAGFDLASPQPIPDVDPYDPSIEQVRPTHMADECDRIKQHLVGDLESELDLYAGREVAELRFMSSHGVDCAGRTGDYFCYAALRYPETVASISKVTVGKTLVPMPERDLDFIRQVHEQAMPEVAVEPGRMRVLFLPETLYGFAWRLQAAITGKSIYEEVSPLRDRLGDQVLSRHITIEDVPLDDEWPIARAFDDEGTPCRNTALVEEGVLRSFCFDRHYAWRVGVESTGHGYRQGIASRIAPQIRHLMMRPGDCSLAELLKLMGRGIVVAGVLGAHSGNILNGDYSIGLSPGLYVEGGQIVGRVKEGMIAGNMYDTLANVVALGDTLYPGHNGRYPAVLVDDVSFAGRV